MLSRRRAKEGEGFLVEREGKGERRGWATLRRQTLYNEGERVGWGEFSCLHVPGVWYGNCRYAGPRAEKIRHVGNAAGIIQTAEQRYVCIRKRKCVSIGCGDGHYMTISTQRLIHTKYVL